VIGVTLVFQSRISSPVFSFFIVSGGVAHMVFVCSWVLMRRF